MGLRRQCVRLSRCGVWGGIAPPGSPTLYQSVLTDLLIWLARITPAFGVARDQSERVLCHHRLPRTGTGINSVTTNEPAGPDTEDRRLASETRPVLFVAFDTESPGATAVWRHAGQDRGTTITSRRACRKPERIFARREVGGRESV